MSDKQEITKSGKDLRSFLSGDIFKDQIRLALPKHMTPDRFARVALTALTKTPKLMDCTRESLLSCLMTCSQLGLEPDGIHSFLIPYKDTCTLIIGYRGLINLARRSGEVVVFRAELVKDEDFFEWNNGVVTHKIEWRKPRGSTQCVYAYVKFRDGAEDWEVLTMDEALSIRDRSQGYKAAIQYNKSHPWITDEGEMLKKTALRRLSKRLTLSPEFMDALDKDGDKLEEPRQLRVVSSARVPELLPPPPPQLDAPVDEMPLNDERMPVAQLLRQKMEASGLAWSDIRKWTQANGVSLPKTIEEAEESDLQEVLNQWDSIAL
jgi:recombination protein RecT